MLTRGRPDEPSLHGERCLENLFEQFALVDAGGRADAQALAFLQQHDLVGVLAGEIQLVGDDDDGVAILGGQAAQRLQQVDLRADVEMQRGFIEQQEQRLLGESAREDDALLFAAGDLIHPAIAEMLGADLRQGILRDERRRRRFRSAAIGRKDGGPAGQIPRLCEGKSSGLSCCTMAMRWARVRGSRSMGDEAVEQHATGKRRSAPEIICSRVDLPLALGPRMATTSPALAWKLVASSVKRGAC